jgi:hypothetical protein
MLRSFPTRRPGGRELLEHQSAIIYGGGGGIGGGPETRPGPTARPPPGCRGRGPARHDGRGRQRRPPAGPGDTAGAAVGRPSEWSGSAGSEEERLLLEEGLTSYLRAAGDTEFRAFKFDVLRIEGGRIAEITTFDATLFPAFGLSPTL